MSTAHVSRVCSRWSQAGPVVTDYIKSQDTRRVCQDQPGYGLAIKMMMFFFIVILNMFFYNQYHRLLCIYTPNSALHEQKVSGSCCWTFHHFSRFPPFQGFLWPGQPDSGKVKSSQIGLGKDEAGPEKSGYPTHLLLEVTSQSQAGTLSRYTLLQ